MTMYKFRFLSKDLEMFEELIGRHFFQLCVAYSAQFEDEFLARVTVFWT